LIVNVLDVNLVGWDGETPLHIAIHQGSLNVIEEILRYPNTEMMNAYDDQKRSSLHMAVEKGTTIIE
jgi:ankyrin repeat protein